MGTRGAEPAPVQCRPLPDARGHVALRPGSPVCREHPGGRPLRSQNPGECVLPGPPGLQELPRNPGLAGVPVR